MEQTTEAGGRSGFMFEVKWWSRWFVAYFPRHIVSRLRYCRGEHRGPLYDGACCLTCGAPWFGGSL